MNANDLRVARKLYDNSKVDAAVVRSLASQLRTMGVVRTLEWLKEKTGSGTLAQRLLGELDMQRIVELETAPRQEVIAAHRRIFALTEALHLIEAVEKRNA